MKRRRPTNRSEARTVILVAANAQRRLHNVNAPMIRRDGFVYLAPALTMRHLHQAVAIVRHQRLVSPEVLALAGFRVARA